VRKSFDTMDAACALVDVYRSASFHDPQDNLIYPRVRNRPSTVKGILELEYLQHQSKLSWMRHRPLSLGASWLIKAVSNWPLRQQCTTNTPRL
jgi:hypothetical protein